MPWRNRLGRAHQIYQKPSHRHVKFEMSIKYKHLTGAFQFNNMHVWNLEGELKI